MIAKYKKSFKVLAGVACFEVYIIAPLCFTVILAIFWIYIKHQIAVVWINHDSRPTLHVIVQHSSTIGQTRGTRDCE